MVQMKRILHLVLACSVLAFLPGCWDYEKINSRSTILGLAVDVVPDRPDEIKVTFEMPVLESTSAGMGGSSDTSSNTRNFINVDGTGRSISEIAREIQLKTDKNVDMADIRSVVLSTQLSGRQMRSVVEDLMRDQRTDKLSYVFATEGKAADLFAAQVATGAPADVLQKKVNRAVKQHGFIVRTGLWELWRDDGTTGIVPMLPVATVSTSASGSTDEALEFTGIELYRNLAPTKMLPRDQAFYLNLVRGAAREMALDVPMGNGTATIANMKDNSRLWTDMVNGQPTLHAHIRVFGTLSKNEMPTTDNQQSVSLSAIERDAEEYLTKQIESCLAELQADGIDAPGFGKLYLIKHPEEVATVKGKWPQLFRQAKLDVQVKVRIRSKGTLI